MKSKIQKQFLLLKGKPVLFYSISCLEKSSEIDDIIIVTGAESVEYVKREIVEPFGLQKVKAVVTGGKERYDSVYEGLKACQNCDYVFIHDGARPFVTEEMIERGKKAVIAGGACVLGVPSKDTVKITDEEGFVERRQNGLESGIFDSSDFLLSGNLFGISKGKAGRNAGNYG